MTYKQSKIHAQLQSSQLVQHLSVQQAKASYFPAILPKAVELKQSYTLPGPPPRRARNRSQLKKKSPQHTEACVLGYLHSELPKFSVAELLRLWALFAIKSFLDVLPYFSG